MAQVIGKSGLKMKGRLARRGYNDEEYKQLVESSSRIGGVIVLKKRSFRKNSLNDYVKVGSC